MRQTYGCEESCKSAEYEVQQGVMYSWLLNLQLQSGDLGNNDYGWLPKVWMNLFIQFYLEDGGSNFIQNVTDPHRPTGPQT